MTWRELLTAAGDKLKKSGIAEYEIDAWYLFSEAFGISRAEFFLCRDRESGIWCPGDLWDSGEIEKMAEAVESEEESMALTPVDQPREESSQADQPREELPQAVQSRETQFGRFRKMICLRSQRIPLQQITGHQEFMGLDFLVNEHVLCPRQDTEVLVETVLKALPEINVIRRDEDAELQILDLCAGSGCIGISLERLAPVPINVLAADISDEAIAVAKANAQGLGCECYHIIKSDLFEQITGTFDVIVSNPPYIPSADIETLEDEVRLHEPRLALDGDEDGLAFYRRISEAAPEHLKAGGRIYYEIGYDQGEAVSQILAENGFTDIRVIKDLAGLDRVVAASCRGEVD